MSDFRSLADEIKREVPGVRVLLDEPMREHTSFRIGGRVPVMFIPEGADALCALCEALSKKSVRPFVMGNGTNLLVEDAELDFPVIKTVSGNERAALTGDTAITAPGGMLLSRLAVFAMQNALTGLEFAHGIPGSLGGAVSMDAGAYGGEMKDVVTKTRAFSFSRGEYAVTGDEHDFSYRHSVFSDADSVIISSELSLLPGETDAIRARMDDLSARRRKSQPLDMPSAGSAFKRPVGGYAAALIDGAGLKGFTVGGAQVSEKHAGFVVNAGGASFDDVLRLLDAVRERVLQTSGIELEPEIRIIRRGITAK